MVRRFTLIELIVVVVVLGVLATVVIPNVSGMNKEASEVALKGNLKSVENATDLFLIDNGYYPVEGKVAEIKSAEGELIDLNQLVPEYLHEKPKGEFFISQAGSISSKSIKTPAPDDADGGGESSGGGSSGGGSSGGGWSGGGGSWTGGGNCSDDKWSNVSGCADRPGTGTSTH